MVMPCKWFRYKEVNALAPNVFDRLNIELVMIDSPFSILFTNLKFESQTGICQTKKCLVCKKGVGITGKREKLKA